MNKYRMLLGNVGLLNVQAWALSAFQEYKQEGLETFYAKVYRLLDALLCICASAIIMLSELLAHLLLQKEF